MQKALYEKLKESVQSIFPIVLIIFLLHFFVAPIPGGTLTLFIPGALLLILGLAVFTLGADLSMMPMGELIGSKLTTSRKLWLIVAGCFILGFGVTVAEPDLQVLTKQVPSVPDVILVGSVAVGVGIFLIISFLRILFQVKLSRLLLVSYSLIFLMAFLGSQEYLAVAFDSAGVTTGPITVPFILAFGIGISSVGGAKNSEEDSFGLCGICSIGPVLAVMITGLFFDSKSTGFSSETVTSVSSFGEMLSVYGKSMIHYLEEVLLVILPIVLIFLVFQIVHLKLPKIKLIKIGVGLIYTVIGLTLFLTGVNIGFLPVGSHLGYTIAAMEHNWIIFPISLVIGVCVVAAEPAVHVLNKQVEEITTGAISNTVMMIGLCTGVGAALVLAMVRVLFQINIMYFLLPVYAISITLSFFVPDIFTGIAFDSGGVVTGAMSVAFLLPFAMGACDATGGNIMTDAFGIVAMVAMMPPITVQIVGLVFKLKKSRAARLAQKALDNFDHISYDSTDILEL